jgi:hypothetical protein
VTTRVPKLRQNNSNVGHATDGRRNNDADTPNAVYGSHIMDPLISTEPMKQIHGQENDTVARSP